MDTRSAPSTEFEDLEAMSDQAFRSYRESQFDPPPFLKTRILALHPERAAGRSRMRRWRGLAFAGFALSVILGSAILFRGESLYDSSVGQRLAITIRDEGDAFRQVTSVQIELPDGVHFQSSELPEIRELPVLTLSWPESGKKPDLPILIQSDETGLKVVKVRYLDSKQREVLSRSLRFRFREKGKETRI